MASKPTAAANRQSITDQPQHQCVLSHREKQQVLRCVAPLARINPHTLHEEATFVAHRLAAARFPERLVRMIETMRTDPGQFPNGFLRVRNLPLDPEVGPTPRHYSEPVERPASIAESVALCIASLVGDPYALSYEQNGRLPAAVVPVPGQEALPINGSSATEFGYHVENITDGVARPHYITLLTVRPDPDGTAATTTSSLLEALPLLSEETRRVLGRAWFRVTPPLAHEGQDRPKLVPVIGPHHVLSFRTYDFFPINRMAAAALAELGRALVSVGRQTATTAGDCLIVNNLTACHGRSSFRAYGDEHPELAARNRYLLRVYSTGSWWLLKHRAIPGTRTLRPE